MTAGDDELDTYEGEENASGVRPLRVVGPDEKPNPDWARSLAANKDGKPTKDAGNVAVILANSAIWRGVLSHNSFADRIIVGDMPRLPNLPDEWPQSMAIPPAGELTEQHDVYVQLWLRKLENVSWNDTAVRKGIVFAAKQHSFNPIVDYLHKCGVEWDGNPRLDLWLHRYLGAENNLYHRRIGAMWIISAVARALNPGCKADHVLVLEGPQGLGKTSALEWLFGSEWFLPELPDLQNKDAMHLLAGVSCALIDELCALRSASGVERAKSYLSRRIDMYRPPYGKDVVRHMRSNIFAATTNATQYLTDETGARRFWVALCKQLAQGLKDDRDQIWGEAVRRFLSGEHWWPEASLTDSIRAQQEARFVADAWEEQLFSHVAAVEWTTTKDSLAALGIEPKDWTPAKQQQCARALRRLGLEQHSTRIGGNQQRRWYSAERWAAHVASVQPAVPELPDYDD